MPKLTINDIEVEVAPGTSVLQAAEQVGIEIPRFCYHDRLSVPANCRMCLVEIEGGPPKPAASCAMACGEGMVVKTETDMVKQARKSVMEMLLINHPLDCPICDQGGECDLQDQAVAYGNDRSRYHENKRAVRDKDLGPLVNTVMTRCINCTRCVRFAEEVAGTPVLGQFYRGEEAEIGTFVDKIVDTELSGNMIDICPVGALTSKPYKFKARSWELRKIDTIDVHDAVGCNIRVDARGREVMRVLPRLHEEVNEEWINDRSRFSYDGLAKGRLDQPYVRDEDTGALQPATWDGAFYAIAQGLQSLKGDEIAGLVGDLVSVEDAFALKGLLKGLGSGHIDCRTDGSQIDPRLRSGYIMNSGIEAIEQADAILLVGVDPRREATLVDTRIRKAVLENRAKVALIGAPCDLTYAYRHLGESPKDLEAFIRSKAFETSERPVIIVGAGAYARKDGAAIQALCHAAADKFNVVTEDWNGFNLLQGAASRVGALDVGCVPQKSSDKGFDQIVAGTKDGSIKALLMLGADEFDAHASVGWQCFTVYIGHHGDAGAQRADVVLPSAAYTEQEGLYVNTEGRPQLARAAVTPPGDARPTWSILRALSERLSHKLPYDSFAALREAVYAAHPHLADTDVRRAEEWGVFESDQSVREEPFVVSVSNFYLTNSICRASETMQKCVRAFLSDDDNQKEAAE